MNAIYTRRSVRDFLDKPIEAQKVEQLLRAAMQAPSAKHQAPWEFIVVQDKDRLKELALYNPYATSLNKATLSIIVLGNSDRFTAPEKWQQDLGASTQNILLEVVEQGLGAVWLGVEGNKDRSEYIKKMFNLGDNLLPYAVLAIGYPTSENANFFRDEFDSSRIHYEKY